MDERRREAVTQPVPTRAALSRADLLLAALLAFAFAPAVLRLADVWASVDYYAHGYLVPFVALYAGVQRAGRLRGLPPRADRRGLLVLLPALLAYLIGAAASIVLVEGVALVAALAGAIWLVRGLVWLRALAFPVGFLLFMVPLPPALVQPAIVALQLVVSSTAVGLLHAFGVDVAQAGNVILLPGGASLFVAEACSGITSLITLTPLAVFLAYFTERTLARRLLLVAAVLPIALAANLARVVGTVLAAGALGVERATQGIVHESWGLIMYLVGLVALLGLGALMRRLRPAATARA